MSKIKWNNSIPWHEVCHRASGRRSYNARRKFAATWRRVQISNLLVEWGLGHGIQARIAKRLGVSESTVSRDIALLMQNSKPCRHCGQWRNQLISRWDSADSQAKLY